jgi:hypothetical protein
MTSIRDKASVIAVAAPLDMLLTRAIVGLRGDCSPPGRVPTSPLWPSGGTGRHAVAGAGGRTGPHCGRNFRTSRLRRGIGDSPISHGRRFSCFDA